MKPYLLMADLHCHAWSTFSKVDANGVNSRLNIIISEFHRACEVLRAAGGDDVVLAGDLFHTRGSIDPEVFNPVHRAFVEEIDKGMQFDALPGNHDLKGKDTTELGNAFTSLAGMPSFRVHNTTGLVPPNYMMIPWESDLKKLRGKIEMCAKKNRAEYDLIIHAGIDGVLTGMPDHGLTAAELEAYGFKRVFAGHYHHHKQMGNVYSIGATTHQTFGDVGAKAGFLLVYADRVDYHASHAPSFVDINEATDPAEIPLIVDGNYVRVRGFKLADPDIIVLRKELMAMNAKGVSIQVARDVVEARATLMETTSTVTLEESIEAYINTMDRADLALVKAECNDILTAVRGA